MWERHTQGYALAVLGVCGGVTWNSSRPFPLRPTLLLKAAGREREALQTCHPWVSQVGTPGEGAPTPLTSATWLGEERSCLPPPPAHLPTASCIPQIFSECPLGAPAWLDSSLLLRSTRFPSSGGSVPRNPQRPEPEAGRHSAPALGSGPCLVPRPRAGGEGRFPA